MSDLISSQVWFQLFSRRRGVLLSYAGLGAFLMILLMHPLLEAIHQWRIGGFSNLSFVDLLWSPIRNSWRSSMWPMTLLLGGVGAVLGVWIASFRMRVATAGVPGLSVPQTDADLHLLIHQGESERLEFKSSLRWDWKQHKVNKDLEVVIAKAMAGFMNHLGGILLIGVDDDGHITGIEADWNTMKNSNWDGFGRCLNNLAKSRLGGQNCGFVHSSCMAVDGKTVAIIKVEASPKPVYCKDSNVERYFVRAGNTTRELDAREAVAHITAKGLSS